MSPGVWGCLDNVRHLQVTDVVTSSPFSNTIEDGPHRAVELPPALRGTITFRPVADTASNVLS